MALKLLAQLIRRGMPATQIMSILSQGSVAQARRSGKIGRNQPCPCGSGRKYKKCHGREASGTSPGMHPQNQKRSPL
jgi:hypothetical protein